MCLENVKELLINNKTWVKNNLSKDENFFHKVSSIHSPKYLWIGCSDARVPVDIILGKNVGNIFVHRNVGNIISSADENIQAVITYAVKYLKIKDIIITGHYDCGAVKAALSDNSFGKLDNWLLNIKEVINENSRLLSNLKGEELINTVSELNVKKQINRIIEFDTIKDVWNNNQILYIHGWIYSVKTGLIKDLKCTINSV